jgi:hypothetical protein
MHSLDVAPTATVTPLRAVQLVAAWDGEIPAWCDAVVEEQDRWLLMEPLSASALFGAEAGHRMRDLARARTDDLILDAARSEPARGGAVLMRRDRPLRLLAVVRDLETRPDVREDWVREALETIVRLVARTPIRGIALPVLGGARDPDTVAAFAEHLAEAVRRGPVARLRIAVQATPGIVQHLAQAMAEHAPELGIECYD